MSKLITPIEILKNRDSDNSDRGFADELFVEIENRDAKIKELENLHGIISERKYGYTPGETPTEKLFTWFLMQEDLTRNGVQYTTHENKDRTLKMLRLAIQQRNALVEEGAYINDAQKYIDAKNEELIEEGKLCL